MSKTLVKRHLLQLPPLVVKLQCLCVAVLIDVKSLVAIGAKKVVPEGQLQLHRLEKVLNLGVRLEFQVGGEVNTGKPDTALTHSILFFNGGPNFQVITNRANQHVSGSPQVF